MLSLSIFGNVRASSRTRKKQQQQQLQQQQTISTFSDDPALTQTDDNNNNRKKKKPPRRVQSFKEQLQSCKFQKDYKLNQKEQKKGSGDPSQQGVEKENNHPACHTRRRGAELRGGGVGTVGGAESRPMKAPSDARSEAVTFLGLLRHEEDRLVERSKELVRRDPAFIQEVFTSMVDEWTPLHACTLRGARKLVKVALKAGVNPNLEMGVPEGLPGRCAPLHLAAYRGDVSILQLLVQHGAHLDKPDDLNRPALFYAVRRRNTLAARKLIKYGADLSALTADEQDFFKDDISRRGSAAVLCIPVPVRTGSQKHKHNHNNDSSSNSNHYNSSSATTTPTPSRSSYHKHQQHHRSSSSSGGGGGSSVKYKTDS